MQRYSFVCIFVQYTSLDKKFEKEERKKAEKKKPWNMLVYGSDIKEHVTKQKNVGVNCSLNHTS